MDEFRLFPFSASTQAAETDLLYFALIGFSGFITALVVTLMVVFGIRYRRGTSAYRGPLPKPLRQETEIGWVLVIAFLAVIIFFWAFLQDTQYLRRGVNPLEIRITAKQWMWKVYHPGGAQEINALHVPRGREVAVLMDSRDVIHSFFVPAFRLKQDVVPGRTLRLRFKADRVGTYRLFCAEFCGAAHSSMTGTVTVMAPAAYARWLESKPQSPSLARTGERLFVSVGCAGCHRTGGREAPDLAGVYGRRVKLRDGTAVEADERYLSDSMLRPRAEVAAGYEPIMPDYSNVLDEDDVLALVAYLKSLGHREDSEERTGHDN